MVAAASLASGNAIFSPGALNAETGGEEIGGILKHADLGGNCGACHTAFWTDETMADRCVYCHRSIDIEHSDAGSLHGHFLSTYTCRDCHTEHQGSLASLTSFELVTFPHETVGFSLRAHVNLWDKTRVDCMTCHTQTVRAFVVDTCAECHLEDDGVFMLDHFQLFGLECLACHDGIDRFSGGYEHAASQFPLEGRHQDVPCVDCHRNHTTLARLRATPRSCAACHSDVDVHEGRLGARCEECHNPQGWRDATIDHTLTRFMLEGVHADVTCAECHIDHQLVGLPDTCYGCHVDDDYHEGRFGTECGACHEQTTWDDWTFDHNLSRFPLTGEHVNVPCERCHTSTPYSDVGSWCGACHADPAYHRGLFSSDCNACHSTFSWLPAPYTGPHRFPMGHGGGTDCRTCHPDSLGGFTCYGCHEHSRSKVQEEHDEEGIGNLSNCVRCHPTGSKEEADDDDD